MKQVSSASLPLRLLLEHLFFLFCFPKSTGITPQKFVNCSPLIHSYCACWKI
jgi:hypothetical protein